MYTCPVCYYNKMQEPPQDFNICECCGTEFGNDDDGCSHSELRGQWIGAGAPWFYKAAPFGWNPWTQLLMAQVGPLPFYGTVALVGSAVSATRIAVESTSDYDYADAA